ncbi:MAG: hypothetical protein PUB18_00135 [bacterium]|nr:hypothetical protein [bacterium]
MAQYALTEEKCIRAEELAEEILGYRAKIENCVNTFDYVLTNTAEVQKWFSDTDAGRVLYDKIMKNNESLLSLANHIALISHHTTQLVNQSRRANSADF